MNFKGIKRYSASLAVHALSALVLAVTVAFTTSAAYAGCAQMAGIKGAGITLPSLSSAGSNIADLEDANPSADASIVGLWHTVYTTSDNEPFGESLKQWHSDGTEFENINLSPLVGNICFGVWKQVGVRTIRLHHVGYNFSNDGVLTGSFSVEETEVLASNGMSYKGSFTFKTYDLKGNYAGVEIKGTIVARRITVS